MTTGFKQRAFIDHHLFRRLDERYGRSDGTADQAGIDAESAILKSQFDKAVEYGMTTYVIFARDFERLLTYDHAGAEIFPADHPQRLKAQIHRAALREVFRYGKSLGLEMIYHSNQLEFPHAIYERIGGEIAGSARVCPGKERTWELYRGKMREFWELFPDCDGLQLTTSETQVAVSTCDCEACRHLSKPERFARLTTEALAVAREFGKTLCLRTWGDMDEPDVYERSVSALPEDVIISIKNTAGDFHLHCGLTPNLGKGRHQQTVEFDCWREYSGWNQLPCYMGDLFAERMRACADAGVFSVGARLNWDPGTRRIFDIPWGNVVNVHLFARLAEDPYQDPDALLDGWIRDHYARAGLDAARAFYKYSYPLQETFLYFNGSLWQDHSRVIRVFSAKDYRHRSAMFLGRRNMVEAPRLCTPEFMEARRRTIEETAAHMATLIAALAPHAPREWSVEMRHQLENERLIARTMAYCLEFYAWMVRAESGEFPGHLDRLETELRQTIDSWRGHDAGHLALMCGENALGMAEELKQSIASPA